MSKINETNYPRRTQASYEDTDMLVIQKAGGNTYTTRIEDLREDCQETLAPALNTMRENLATIEGSTASKAYAKGDYLVFGGRLCKAKTSIAVNATLILDTNIELAPVGDELSSISSDLTNLSLASFSERVDIQAGSTYTATLLPDSIYFVGSSTNVTKEAYLLMTNSNGVNIESLIAVPTANIAITSSGLTLSAKNNTAYRLSMRIALIGRTN